MNRLKRGDRVKIGMSPVRKKFNPQESFGGMVGTFVGMHRVGNGKVNRGSKVAGIDYARVKLDGYEAPNKRGTVLIPPEDLILTRR